MARESGGPLLAFIRGLAGSRGHCDQTDGELLQRFAQRREASAFNALMERHGPMVLGVCRGILRDAHDAEDAFQATFLVLVRNPQSIGKPASVASWLHGVAYRLATRARAESARRRAHERQALPVPKEDSREDVDWRDLRPVLHEEVDRLPERYRLPFVLCYLEGKTNEEAAKLLGCPKGTVLSRLSRARERLRRRLTRRGLALTSGLGAVLAQATAQAAVPAALRENTLQAALLFVTGVEAVTGIAPPVRAYAEGMLHAARAVRLKLTVGGLLAVVAVGAATGVLIDRVRPAAPEDRASAATTPTPQMAPRPVPDRERIQGAWRVTAAEQFGRQTDALTNRLFVFRGDRFTLRAGRGEIRGVIPSGGLEGDFTLEPAGPNRIDLRQEVWHLHGMYSLEGENLRLCVSNAREDERPTELTTNRSNRQVLLTLSRDR
jgi:RNA polymerase sigma factor (sigma-70 family)